MTRTRICALRNLVFSVLVVVLRPSNDRCQGQAIGLTPFEMGRIAFEKKQYDEAISHFSEAIRLEPTNPKVFGARGACLLLANEFGKSVFDFDKAIELDPRYVRARLNRGAALRLLDKPDRAILDFDVVVSLDKKDFTALNQRGGCYMQLAHCASRVGMSASSQRYVRMALEDQNEVLQLSPDEPLFYSQHAYIHELLGQFDPARADYSKAIDLFPNDRAKLLRDRGRLNLLAGCPRDALSDFEKGLQLEPDNTELIESRGMAHCHLANYERGLIELGRAIALDPANSGFRLDRILVYLVMGKPELAREDLDTLISRQANCAPLYYYLRAHSRLQSNQFDDALRDLDNGIQLDDTFHRLFGLGLRAICQYRKGDHVAAIDEITNCINAGNTDPEAFALRAMAERELGRFSESLRDCQTVIAKSPNACQGYYLRAKTYERAGKLDSALADCDAAIRRDSGIPLLYETRSRIRSKLGLDANDDLKAAAALRVAQQPAPPDSLSIQRWRYMFDVPDFPRSADWAECAGKRQFPYIEFSDEMFQPRIKKQ